MTLETSTGPAGLTARARPKARPGTRAANLTLSLRGGKRQNTGEHYKVGVLDMASNDKESQADQQRRIGAEIQRLQGWTRPRIIAYRRQRDLWQKATYYLLTLSAITAIGAAISAGLSARLSSIIFAGVSAGVSVINASLKTVAQISKSEKALTAVSALQAKIRAFSTDSPGLSTQIRESRLKELRKEYEEALKLPEPSQKELEKAVISMRTMPSDMAFAVGRDMRIGL